LAEKEYTVSAEIGIRLKNLAKVRMSCWGLARLKGMQKDNLEKVGAPEVWKQALTRLTPVD
jgi:hypothetical protein